MKMTSETNPLQLSLQGSSTSTPVTSTDWITYSPSATMLTPWLAQRYNTLVDHGRRLSALETWKRDIGEAGADATARQLADVVLKA